MPLEQAVWRIDNKLQKLDAATLAKEIELERFIEEDVSILNAGWLIIGRQVASDVGPIDLLALDREGGLVVVELKKQQTTREITAQALDYAAWVESLTSDAIAGLYSRYCERYRPQDIHTTLDTVFRQRFGSDLQVDALNGSHKIVLVASELDARTERIVRYLAGRGIDMNVLFFQVFSDGEKRYLSRVWMLDAEEIEERSSRRRAGSSEEWNGEYYASFGIGEHRDWDDAVKYGFLSAGGGRWYSNTLDLLVPGGRVWVNIPKSGYVGVGEVNGPVQSLADFFVSEADGSRVRFLDVSKNRAGLLATSQSADSCEYFVPISWIKTVPRDRAVSEVGFFGNQNSVCKPKKPKWTHTVERLKQLFDVK